MHKKILIVTELDNQYGKNNGDAIYNNLCQTVNYRVAEKKSTEDFIKVLEIKKKFEINIKDLLFNY